MSTNKQFSSKVVTLVAFVLAGMILSSLFSIIPMLLEGVDLQSLGEKPNDVQKKLSANSLKVLLFMNQIFMFLLPTIITVFIFHKSKIWSYLGLDRTPNIQYILLSILFVFCAYPIVNASFYVNALIPLPDWMHHSERATQAILEKILDTDSILKTLTSIFIISVTPAICEEIIFRGFIQKVLQDKLKKDHLAIWITATIFSLIHFQFEGFLPRLTLGALMGYCYYWSKNLWVPIIVHGLNNLIPILAMLMLGKNLTDTTQQEPEINIWLLIGSIVATIIIVRIFMRYKSKDLHEQHS